MQQDSSIKCLSSIGTIRGSENFSMVSTQWSHGVSTGTLRLMKRSIRPFTSPIDEHKLKLFLH